MIVEDQEEEEEMGGPKRQYWILKLRVMSPVCVVFVASGKMLDGVGDCAADYAF